MDFSYLLLIQRIREACGGIFDSLMLNITSLANGIITYLLLGAFTGVWISGQGS